MMPPLCAGLLPQCAIPYYQAHPVVSGLRGFVDDVGEVSSGSPYWSPGA
jgi:hypothetical protein